MCFNGPCRNWTCKNEAFDFVQCSHGYWKGQHWASYEATCKTANAKSYLALVSLHVGQSYIYNIVLMSIEKREFIYNGNCFIHCGSLSSNMCFMSSTPFNISEAFLMLVLMTSFSSNFPVFDEEPRSIFCGFIIYAMYYDVYQILHVLVLYCAPQ